MYKYLFNKDSTSTLDEAWRTKITESLEKHRINAPLNSWDSEEELGKQIGSLSKSTTNTLVVVGNDKDFSLVIGMLGGLDESVAVGFIPLNNGPISQRLQHKSWESAIVSLAQRRIHETKLFSVGNRYFLDSISFSIKPSTNPLPVIVTADSNLNLRLPDCKLHFENLSDDQFLNKMPVFFSAESISQHEEAKNDLLGGLRKKLKITTSPQKQLVASLHGKVFHIESASEITDELGCSYKNSLWVGKQSRPIRLITGRKSEPD